MRVAVIGAGPTGLVAAKYLKDSKFEIDVYERRHTIGGVWRDRDVPEEFKDDVIAVSPVYDEMRTNSPIESFKYEGLVLDCNEDKTFFPWTVINKYLKKYTDTFDLWQHLKLETEVKQVSRRNNEWNVETRHLPTGSLTEKCYDAVLVCNGHEDVPYIPEFEGITSFQGTQMHSKLFRNSKQFQNKNVLVIGSGASGIDIVLIISPDVNMVYFSHHKTNLYKEQFPNNVIHKPDIKNFTKDSAMFIDGTAAVVDVIIYCTGYQYNIDFLDETCGVSLGKKYVKNLYKEMFCIEEPTLIFLSIHRVSFNVNVAELQVKVALKVLKNEMKLPSKDEMFEDTKRKEEKFRSEGLKEEEFHVLGARGKEYMLDLAHFAALPEPPKCYFELLNAFHLQFIGRPLTFRNHTFKILDATFIFK